MMTTDIVHCPKMMTDKLALVQNPNKADVVTFTSQELCTNVFPPVDVILTKVAKTMLVLIGSSLALLL